jgi:hypothetical protein
MARKITRILLRLGGAVFLLLLITIITFFFAIQMPRFQTWLGRKAGNYLGRELGTTVRVNAVKLRFFTNADLEGILLLDKNNDTIFSGDLGARISLLDIRNQKLDISEATLRGSTAKLIRYKGDKTWNYQFLADYFGGSGDSTKQGWDVKIHQVNLSEVAFVYRDEKRAGTSPGTIDYDDVWVQHTSGTIDNIRLDSGVIRVSVHHLRTREKSGFILNELITNATISNNDLIFENLRIKTPGSLIKGEIHFKHESWDDYDDFVNRVVMNTRFEDSTIVNTPDIAFFASELKGLDKKISLIGKGKGLVNDFNLDNFTFAFGAGTRFRGDISISGLPDVSASFIHMDAKELRTSYEDLMSIPDYPFAEGEKLPFPKELAKLGLFTYKGKLDGFISDFTTHGTFVTKLGEATTQLSLKTGKSSDDIQYKGRVLTEAFELGTFLDLDDIGAIGIDARIEGKGLDVKTLEAEVEGSVRRLDFHGYSYQGIKINGSFSDKVFTGLVVSQDPNAAFDFNGTINFTNKMPEMDFISSISRLNPSALHFSTRADTGYLSTQILIDIKGDNINNLTGVINLDNTVFKTKTKTYKLATFNILMDQSTPTKKINLRSEYVNMAVAGNFEISNLEGAFKKLLYSYYPTFFKKPVQDKLYTDAFSLTLNVRNFNSIVELFLPGLKVSAGSKAEATFDAANNKLNLQFSAPDISYNQIRVKELLGIVNENNNTVLAEFSGKSLQFSDSLALSNFNFQTNSVDKDSQYNFEWDNLTKPSSNGLMAGKLTFGSTAITLRNEKLSLTVNDTTWKLREAHDVVLEKDGTIDVGPMFVSSNNQHISVAGRLSESATDSLVFGLNKINLKQLNPLLQMVNLNLEGSLSGNVALNNVHNTLAFNGNLNVLGLKLNDNTLGEMKVHAKYNAGEKQIWMQGFTSLGLTDEQGNAAKNIAFSGTYYLDKKEESLDFDVSAKPANLKLLNPFLKDIITIKNGFVNGEAKVHGTPSQIKIDGQFKLFNSEIKVDYTNVSYNVTGLIEVMPDQIRFSELLMREKGSRSAPQGTINGNIFHSNFDRMQIDYDISYRNMLLLNTTERDNSTYYGKIYGDGNVGIYGYINNLHMEITATTAKNSVFSLPLDGPAEIGESEFIHFVKKDTIRPKTKKAITGFDLLMKIHATPDCQAQIILDKQHGDKLTAQGDGDLRLQINTLGKFEMFGDYVITNGHYLFTLENVINKRFEIDPGSSISWSGDPYNAEVDVVTTYRQRTSIEPLLNDPNYKNRVPVECRLLISGRLQNPQVKFEVDFPSTDANAKARIASVLSDEAELNRQVFSFLLFRSFQSPLIFNQHGGGVNAGGLAASTGSEMLSNRVSDFLNTYVGNITGIGDLQLGLNYRPGSENSTEAVDLALSKQFLNNKVTVDGNFGVNSAPTATRSSGLIGDVNIDYKLSDDGRFRLRGFNRSNDNTAIATRGGPYTQGIGFFYREEFESFKLLFARYLKKKKPLPANQPPQSP